jgi:hypothetical protein
MVNEEGNVATMALRSCNKGGWLFNVFCKISFQVSKYVLHLHVAKGIATTNFARLHFYIIFKKNPALFAYV